MADPRPDVTRLLARLRTYVPVHVADQIAADVQDSLWLALHDQHVVREALDVDEATLELCDAAVASARDGSERDVVRAVLATLRAVSGT